VELRQQIDTGGEDQYRPMNQQDLAIAKDNIGNFALVGISER